MEDKEVFDNIVVSILAFIIGIVLVKYDLRKKTKTEYMGYIFTFLVLANFLFTFMTTWVSLAVIILIRDYMLIHIGIWNYIGLRRKLIGATEHVKTEKNLRRRIKLVIISIIILSVVTLIRTLFAILYG